MRTKLQTAHDEYIQREHDRLKTLRSIDEKVERLRACGFEAWDNEQTKELLHGLLVEQHEDHRPSGD